MRMNVLHNILLLILLGWNAGTVHATNVLAYAFTNGSVTPSTQVGATGSAITASPTGMTILPEADAANSIALQPLTASVDESMYAEWTVTPVASPPLFNVLKVSAAKGGASDPRGFVVRSSLDSYTADLMNVTLTTVYPSWVTYSASLGTSFIGLTSPVTLRLYPYVPAFPGRYVDVDSIELLYATEAPSAAPSVSPTSAPSMLPTLSPTLSPSAQPTMSPTLAPSQAPTGCPTTKLRAKVSRSLAKPGSLIRFNVKVATSVLVPEVLLSVTLPAGVTYVNSKTAPAQPSPAVNGGDLVWRDVFAAVPDKKLARYRAGNKEVGRFLHFTVSVRVNANVQRRVQLRFEAQIGGSICEKMATASSTVRK